MTCTILEKDDCVKLKMGSYLAVSQVLFMFSLVQFLEKDDCVKLKMGSYLAVSQVLFMFSLVQFSTVHTHTYTHTHTHIHTHTHTGGCRAAHVHSLGLF
jgi:hypothetical protein